MVRSIAPERARDDRICVAAVRYNKTAHSWEPAHRVNFKRSLFLDDLRVLQHGDATALSHFAFDRNCFARVFRKLMVHWLVFTDDQIRLSVGNDADRSTTFDALGPAGLAMFFTHRVVIDVAHHIDNFARNFFGRRGVEILLALLRSQGERRKRESRNESGCDRHFQTSRNCGIEHTRNVRSKVVPVNYSGRIAVVAAAVTGGRRYVVSPSINFANWPKK